MCFLDEETEAQEVPKLECKRSWARAPILQAPGTDTASEENRHWSEGITCHLPTVSSSAPLKSCAHRPHLCFSLWESKGRNKWDSYHCVYTIGSNNKGRKRNGHCCYSPEGCGIS